MLVEGTMRRIMNRTRFEILDALWEAEGMLGFTPHARAFSVAPSQKGTIVVVPISDIAAPVRDSGVRLFDEEKLIAILRAFRSGTPLPPVEVNETSATPYRYKVFDGYHRYYASAAAGFSDLPVVIVCDVKKFLADAELQG
jgi:hypothetical protein